jgi:hypothetical protein
LAHYRWLVFTNCTPGREAEFDRWYDETHVPDLLRIPGVVGVTRGAVAGTQMVTLDTGELQHGDAAQVRFRFLAVYEFETDDPKRVLEEVRVRARTPQMEITPLLEDVYTVLYQDR